ncbi:hypothetical protein BD770DRAFT_175916 [Pilaira anomala]|nr:hypothetical protein BD770DRAFT_175916 [Pilaira anomala]
MGTKMRMKAVFDCSADEVGEISFRQGDILVDVEKSGEEGWFSGRVENTTERGLFPYNYVERISDLTADEKSNLPGFPSIDAFEKAMAGTKVLKQPPPIMSPKPKLTIAANTNTTLPPTISEKPILSPTRVRSYSTSAAILNKSTKPLIHGKDITALEKALIKGPKPSSLRSNSFSSTKQSNLSSATAAVSANGGGVPLVGLANLKLANSISNEVEEEDDGYQMVKPSQLRQSNNPVPWKKPIEKSTEKPNIEKMIDKTAEKSTAAAAEKPSKKLVPKPTEKSIKLDLPASSNPMPRLPTRPVSTANRRSRHARSTPSTMVVKETEKVPPPILKPKPVLSQPHLPPRPSSNSTKSRSTSNPPPPIQPKPAMSSIEILLSKNAEKKNLDHDSVPSNELVRTSSLTKPVYPKPSSTSTAPSRPSLDSWQTPNGESNVKPSSLLNRARSATNPTTQTSMDWTSMLTKPKSNSSGIKENGQKIPPPPPPSRVPKSSKTVKDRYEILFDMIQDDGYVDGETARFIWMKSKLSNEELSTIWKQCEPEKGLLDKQAFIDGMKRIDGLLLNKQVVI